jgi:hypothetical protein
MDRMLSIAVAAPTAITALKLRDVIRFRAYGVGWR